MAVFLYNIITKAYFFSIKIAALFHPKARLWINGRRNIFPILKKQLKQKRKEGQPLLWVHCASLGEFEQGRPIIEKIKKEHSHIFILLTFFSPSGFEVRRKYEYADHVCYLPADGQKNARLFIETINPDLAVFVKYEFWFYYLYTLKSKKIPAFLVAAIFRKKQPFFKWWGKLHREMLNCFTELWVQEKGSKNLLSEIGFENVEIYGDPRIDRVLSIAEAKKEFPLVKKFCRTAPTMVCGSTWPEGEECLSHIISNNNFSMWKFIIAPHDISEKRLADVEKRFGKKEVVKYSELGNTINAFSKKILLVDNIGLLSFLYFYGKTAYIGGGFGAGIHNILEPMAFGLPVIFGPKYHKFREAVLARENGCGFVIQDGAELRRVFETLNEGQFLTQAMQAAMLQMAENKGATRAVVKALAPYLPQYRSHPDEQAILPPRKD